MKVTFVLPAYKAKFLYQAVESIVNQTYNDWELIVVDDCSPEDLKPIIDRFRDSRIQYFRNETNIGGQNLVYQWNHSIKYSTGEYTILAADDDQYEPTFLEEMLKLALKYPESNVIRARVRVIDENGDIIGLDETISEYCSIIEYIYHWLRATIIVCIGNYMFKTDILQDKKFIDFPSAFCSDIASIINFADNGVVNSPSLLFSFRVSTIHLSSNMGKLADKLDANNQFYKWLLDLKMPEVTSVEEDFLLQQISRENLLDKCKYDYYNQIFKHLAINELGFLADFELLSNKDKFRMIVRYFFDKVFK
ncbi:glycosyltransferase family 2 protein [Sphingobacterium bovistauri]|uniref:Glycosyltransferase family 2 protein n=1 Tax=Sphingobacterium bovistauri TaxID=2781959 RepID=A0ABS7Z1S0_9SPHI|nr:glycosyltransferase family 2 protein [Sphingobacterium bovistauri]MCA5004117.1 glycosyltransferase family 2 protein [Sphingobacterium bovistauri]